MAVALLVVAIVVGGVAWWNRSPETWVEIAPGDLNVTVGAAQPLSVSLQYKPRFRGRGAARPIAGTIQLISFPTAVDVSPTTVVTTANTPRATFQVKGVRRGEEELVFGASDRPTDQRSWQTATVRAVVGAAAAPRPGNR